MESDQHTNSQFWAEKVSNAILSLFFFFFQSVSFVQFVHSVNMSAS